jgi:hypothetical protein
MGSYWDCLSGFEKKLMYAKEIYFRNVLSIQNLTDENLEKLRLADNKDKILTGETSFDILGNTHYTDLF